MFHLFCVIDGILYTETWDTEYQIQCAVDVLKQIRGCEEVRVVKGTLIEV